MLAEVHSSSRNQIITSKTLFFAELLLSSSFSDRREISYDLFLCDDIQILEVSSYEQLGNAKLLHKESHRIFFQLWFDISLQASPVRKHRNVTETFVNCIALHNCKTIFYL